MEADRDEREAASLIRSQAVKIKALNQEVSDKCDSINVWRAKCVEAEEALKAQLATARNDALEEAAKAGRKAVMSFKGKVGGKYYAGYHEDMREYVAAEIRAMKEG